MIYLDFSKVFNKIPIQRLLGKIKLMELPVRFGNGLRCVLDVGNKEFKLMVRTFTAAVINGVPQGVGLNLLLFPIYTNNLNSITSSDIGKIADNTKIGRVISCSHDAEILKVELNRRCEWSEKMQM